MTTHGNTTPDLVWYAGYGSNLAYQQRFLCYIRGGTPVGSLKANPGCRDTSPPLDMRPIVLNFELFFAGHFRAWGGSAAFIRAGNAQATVLGRMYLITDEQFNDIVLQENGRTVDGRRLLPPIAQLSGVHDCVLPDLKAYDRFLVVGHVGGHPVITFTVADGKAPPIAPPTEPYVKIIATGIKETYPEMSEHEIVRYLLRADGIKDQIRSDSLATWVAESSSFA
jgi:hypothetical protein